jgi:hypothetical protein
MVKKVDEKKIDSILKKMYYDLSTAGVLEPFSPLAIFHPGKMAI